MNSSQQQTALEKLTAEKSRVRKLIKQQEATMNEHVTYVQANAGSLLLSFLSAVIFSPSAKKEEQNSTAYAEENAVAVPSAPLSFADFIPMAKFILPVAWDIARPLLISWGIKKAGTLAARLFARKV